MFDEMMSLSRTPLKTNQINIDIHFDTKANSQNMAKEEGILVNEDMHKGSYGIAPTPFNRVASLLCCFLQPLPFFFLTIFHLSF